MSRSPLFPYAFLPLLFLFSSEGLHSQCTSFLFNGTGTGDLIRLEGVGISDSQLNAAANYWGAACPSYGNGFPLFTTADTSAGTEVTVIYRGGSNSVCGNAQHLTPTSIVINLWDQGQTANGTSYVCNVTDTLAHELGHALDLANSTCSGGMMGPAPLSFVNGRVVAGTRSVSGEECNAVTDRWVTTYDNNTVSDPWCNAYCWTECVNNGCPGGNPNTGCPILIDTENDGIRLTGLGDPVWFDIDADGVPDLISWTDRSEGILTLDRNGNGMIDDGSELFGNATQLADGRRALNGYIALAEFDSWGFGGNRDEYIDGLDEIFSSLRLWTDLNHDGVSQPVELRSLDAVGIRRIGLGYRRSNRTDRYGNEFRFLGRAWKVGPLGHARPTLTWDVFFLVAP
jgi:hypothetical protein